MIASIWESCDGPRQIDTLQGTLHRLVESQEQIASLGFVDTLEEQALLEALLERSKPPYRAGSASDHYLLRTPFRYPPLPWGSRFGQIHQPGILYGGLSHTTTLAESAYYRLVFWHSMQGIPPKAAIHSQHALFTVAYKTARGVHLQDPPFDQYASQITDPADYRDTQRLGIAMRAADVQAFEYPSARDPAHGLCVGLFVPQALAQKRPQHIMPWLCETRAETVFFKASRAPTVITYRISDFQQDGRLPMPA
ncbi:MAG TPA: RES family NAD+ phosphorylase [Castellaniella sp.]|nr:RES family NAD+ phosphorylase [Castellaniella sp.]